MSLSRRLRVALASLLLLAPAALADCPPSPLRLVPAETDLLVSVPDARRVAETLLGLELLPKLGEFSAYREALDSTNFRHFRQFVAYYEKEMGAPWPQLLDEVAGGGAVVGIKFGKDPAPALLVVQGQDEKRVKQFARLAFDLLEQETVRQDERAKVTKGKYEGVQTIQVGDKFFAAVAGPAILVSNEETTLHASLDLHLGRSGKSCADLPAVGQAAKILPTRPLASLWLNLEPLKKSATAAAAFRMAPRDDPVQTILVGGYLDVIGRSPFVAAALVREGDDFHVTVRMPKGREGMGPDSLLHVPPAGSTGSRPLLQPKGAIFSTSFYLDVGRIWQDRDKLFPEKIAKAFEKADKDTNPFLAGLKISKILPQVGLYHRFVIAAQPAPADHSRKQRDTAFAVVTDLREPEKFSQSVETALRGAALLAGFKVKLKLVEEKVGDVKLVGYRFAEEQPEYPDVNENVFRSYSPCFARVGDQFFVCSSLDLGRELIGILQNEKKGGSSDAVRSRLFGNGAADALQLFEDQLVTQGVLDRALPVDRATAEVKAALALLRSLGPLDIDVRYHDDHFSYDFRLKGLK
jgi:hypothetical protein